MKQYDRYEWANIAAGGIARGKEREQAWFELMDHIEDHAEALQAAGVPEKEAFARATEAMGDPHAVRGQLRRVHRPVLTWLLRIFRVVLCCTAAVTIVTLQLSHPWESRICARSVSMGVFGLERDALLSVPPPEETLYAEQTLYRRSGSADKQMQVRDCTISVSRYAVSRYAVSRVESLHYGEWMVALEVQLAPAHFWDPVPQIQGWFTLTDSNGNYRDEIRQDIPWDEEMYCSCLDVWEGRSDVHILFAWLPEDCSWVDLTYTDAENTATLRIDVKGGAVYEAAAE